MTNPQPTSSALQKARELVALEAKALPAPFFDGNTDDGKRLVLSGNQKYSKYAFDVTTQQSSGPLWYIEESAKERNATCDFLIELRNAFPSIHAELEKVTAENAKLLADWRKMKDVLLFIEQFPCNKNVFDTQSVARNTLSSLSYQDSTTAHD